MAVSVGRRQLAGTAALGLVFSVMAGAPAWANTVNGAPAPAYTIKIGPTVSTVDVVIDTADVGGPGSVGLAPVITPTSRVETAAIEITNAGTTTITNSSFGRVIGAYNTYSGIWINRGTDAAAANPLPGQTATVNIINHGDIIGSEFGIEVTALCGANCTNQQMGTVSISGAQTGRVYGKTAMMLRANTVNIDGMNGIAGWDTGIFGWQDGINVAATTINIGQTSQLGRVQAGTGSGIIASGDTIRMNVWRVLSGGTSGAGISATSGSLGLTSIGVQEVVSNGDGIRVSRNAGSTTISGSSLSSTSGTIVAGLTGIRVDNPGTSSASTNTFITAFSSIRSSGTGIRIARDTAPAAWQGSVVTMRNIGSITAGGTGIHLSSYDTIRIGTYGIEGSGVFARVVDDFVGPITAGAYGILVDQPSRAGLQGAVTAFVGNINAGIGVGVFGGSLSFTMSFRGNVNASQTGVYIFDTFGQVTLRSVNNVSGSISGASEGIVIIGSPFYDSFSPITISNLLSVRATNGDAIRLSKNTDQLIEGYFTSGNMQITAGGNGISVTGGNLTLRGITSIVAGQRGIDIVNGGSVTYGGTFQNVMGTVTGQTDGIRILSQAGAGASVTMTIANNITGVTGNGIFQRNSGSVTINVTGGTVSGAVAGMDVTSTGSLAVTVGAGGTVQGSTGMVFSMPATPQNLTGTLVNAGLIRSTATPGSGPDVALASNGQVSVTNTGTITGKITHNATAGFGTLSLSFGNSASGVWNPGTGSASFGGAADTVTNAGTINLGSTTLTGLEFLTQTTGTINFQGSTAATDQLTIGGAFINLGGGRIKVNFDADGALGILDRGTSGTADTIVAASTGASGVTLVDIAATGGTNGAGSPVPLTGSVAIVSSGTALAAPAPGATLVASANYAFGTGNPSTASRTFALVGDGLGGVFLQWVPVTSGGTIGGFSGGALGAVDSVGGGVGGGLGFLQASLAGASQAAVQVADMTSFGAAFGGTGAAGAGCGSANGASFSVRTGEWAGTGRRSASGASAQGRDLAFSPGAGANSCGRVSVGAFQFGGTATVGLQAQRGTDAARGTAQGAGGYVRADSGTGLFAQLTGAAGSQRAQVRNGIFGTEATVDTTLGLVDITAGYATPISDGLAIETRVSATRLSSAANPFRDSLGYEVTRLDTRADSLTATAGLIARTGSGGQGFVRAGIRTTDARQDGLAYGIRTLSQDSGTGSVLEAGWNQPLGEEASVEFALSSDSGGPLERQEARVQLSFGW